MNKDYLQFMIPIYNRRVIVKFTDDFLKFIERFRITLPSDINDDWGLHFFSNLNQSSFILIKDNHINDWGTITHEALHCTNHLLYNRGIEVPLNNDEAQTYLLGYIVEKIQKYIEKLNK